MVVFWFKFATLISCYYLVGLKFFTPIGKGNGAQWTDIFMLLLVGFTYKI